MSSSSYTACPTPAQASALAGQTASACSLAPSHSLLPCIARVPATGWLVLSHTVLSYAMAADLAILVAGLQLRSSEAELVHKAPLLGLGAHLHALPQVEGRILAAHLRGIAVSHRLSVHRRALWMCSGLCTCSLTGLPGWHQHSWCSMGYVIVTFPLVAQMDKMPG